MSVQDEHGVIVNVGIVRGYVFRAQSQEIKERGGHQSSGIDFFITQERVIFLDTQVPNKTEFYLKIVHRRK